MYSINSGNCTARTANLILPNSPLNQLNTPYIPGNEYKGGMCGLGDILQTNGNSLGDLESFFSSFGGSAVGFALIAGLLILGQNFFGADAKQARGRKKLSALDAKYKGQVGLVKAKYGLAD